MRIGLSQRLRRVAPPEWWRLTTPRSLLLIIAGLAGLSYAWGISRDGLEPFYAAAVRSMGTNWHNFFSGAFDPAGTVTVDKLPGALWIQALSVRIFGYHTWAIVLPQVIEGVLSVLVLYRAVNRLRERRPPSLPPSSWRPVPRPSPSTGATSPTPP